MSFCIKTVLHIDGMEYTLPLPQTQKDFDKYLTESGILTGDPSEYSIAEIECDYIDFSSIMYQAQDIEVLNYLAQRLDKFDESELNDYVAIACAKEEISMKMLIDLTVKFDGIEIFPNVNDTEELGQMYFNDNYPGFQDDLIIDSINYGTLGEGVKLQELGEFTDAGYIKEFNKIFLSPIYDGKSFPYFDYENDYSLKIRLCNGAVKENNIENKYVDITLPASGEVFARAMRRLNMDNLHESHISDFFSSRFGQDMMKLFSSDEPIASLNVLAMKMDQIPHESINEYKEAVAYEMIEGDIDEMITLTDKFMSGEHRKEKAMRDCKEETIRRLTCSAVDMAAALGKDAAADIEVLKKQVVNFVNKWDLTEKWIDQFDMDVADAMQPEQPDETEDQESGMSMM